MLSWEEHFTERNAQLPTRRQRLIKTSGNARYLTTNSQQLLNFISNDYLGLSSHEEIRAAFHRASSRYGIGSSGAPSLSGYSEEHHELAAALAQWLGYAQCLLFSSGYQLNSSIFSQLVDNNTWVWLDKRCHASHIDGIRLAQAKFTTFNAATLETTLLKIASQPQRRHLILSEGSFSMDGTCNYWNKLIHFKAANPANVLLVIDDAHGIGALGARGHGTLEQLGLNFAMIDLVIGTFGKAFGTHGGFICGAAPLIDYLQQSVRSQIFSTNLPPALAAATRCSLALITSSHGQKLRAKLTATISYFQQLATHADLNCSATNYSAIQLLSYSDSRSVTACHNHLLARQIIVGKMLYPTVPKATPRLRISLNACHKAADLESLIAHLGGAGV